MVRKTSILLGNHYEGFIRAKLLIAELEAGENSKILTDFNPSENLTKLHAKHLQK